MTPSRQSEPIAQMPTLAVLLPPLQLRRAHAPAPLSTSRSLSRSRRARGAQDLYVLRAVCCSRGAAARARAVAGQFQRGYKAPVQRLFGHASGDEVWGEGELRRRSQGREKDDSTYRNQPSLECRCLPPVWCDGGSGSYHDVSTGSRTSRYA